MDKIIITVILSVVIAGAITTCQPTVNRQSQHPVKIVNAVLEEKETRIINTKMFEGYMEGANFERGEVYINPISKKKRNHLIEIIDMKTGEMKKEMNLSKGSVQSPTDLYGPSYMEFLKDNYYIFDQHHKIVVFDVYLRFLFSSMFHKFRYFVDFYSRDNRLYYVFGTRNIGNKKNRCKTELYEMRKGRRPQIIKQLAETYHKSLYYKNGKKYYYIGYFWSSSWGFEKDGGIYYTDNSENKYYRYNLDLGKTEVFQLAYLKSKRYSAEDAKKMGRYKDTDWQKRMRRKVVYVSNSDEVYHFGLFDVGDYKIGIVGDINPDNMTFRLDIIDSQSGEYRESIRLPFGVGFIETISTQARGFYQSYINLDHGLYLWNDLEGKELETTVKITRFKIKREPLENR